MSPGQAELARTPLLQASPSNSQCELPVATFGGVLADRRTVALGDDAVVGEARVVEASQ